jgi:hypothetical protein
MEEKVATLLSQHALIDEENSVLHEQVSTDLL